MNEELRREIDIQLVLVKKGLEEVLESCTDPKHPLRDYKKTHSREHQEKFVGNILYLLELLKKAGCIPADFGAKHRSGIPARLGGGAASAR